MFLSAYFFLGQLGVCILSRLFPLRNGDGVLTLYLTYEFPGFIGGGQRWR